MRWMWVLAVLGCGTNRVELERRDGARLKGEVVERHDRMVVVEAHQGPLLDQRVSVRIDDLRAVRYTHGGTVAMVLGGLTLFLAGNSFAAGTRAQPEGHASPPPDMFYISGAILAALGAGIAGLGVYQRSESVELLGPAQDLPPIGIGR